MPLPSTLVQVPVATAATFLFQLAVPQTRVVVPWVVRFRWLEAAVPEVAMCTSVAVSQLGELQPLLEVPYF